MRRRSSAMRTILCLLAIVGPSVGTTSLAWAGVADKPLPVKTWRKTANDICRQAKQLRSEIASEVFADLAQDEQPSAALLTAYVGQIEPVVQQQIDSIGALEEPTSLEKKVAKLLKTARKELDALVADPANFTEANPFSATELAAKKLKLQQCA